MSKSISKNALFKAVLNMFNIILPILVTPLLTRAIGPDLYGYQGFGDSLTAYFLIFASFGIYQYGLREISRVRDDKKKLEQTFTTLCMFTFLTNIVVTIVYMASVFIFYRETPYFYTCIIMGFNIVSNMFYVEWLNEALENYEFIAMKTMLVRILYSLMIIFFVKSTGDFYFYLFIMVGFNFINNILSFVYVKKRIKFDFSDMHFAKHIKPMFFVVILSNVGTLYTQLDKIMLEKIPDGTTAIGYYYTAQKIMTIINTLMLTVIQVTMPRMSNYLGEETNENYLSLLRKVIKYYFLLLFPASMGLLCLSKEIIYLFGGQQYMPAASMMALFAVYMLSIGVENIIENQVLYLNGKEKEESFMILAGGILNLVLNSVLYFTGLFTAETAITTTFISNVVLIAIEYIYAEKKLKLNLKLFAFENMKYFIYSLTFIPLIFLINKLGLGEFVENAIYSASSGAGAAKVALACVIHTAACVIVYAAILIFTKDKVFFEIVNKLKSKILRK